LFTVRPRTRVPAQYQGLPLTRIGTMRKGPAGLVELGDSPLAPLGFDHFRNRP